MKIFEELKEVERKYNVTILYCSEVGSKLFGTNHADSDSDFRFIYLPSTTDVLLKRDKDSIKVGPQTNDKNTKDDVDFDGWSVNKFFNLVQKGETNTMNLMFSMFREDTIVFDNHTFTNLVKNNIDKLINKNMKSFTGYALKQAKKFGIKGAKYDELTQFVAYLNTFPKRDAMKLKDCFESFRVEIEENNYKYVKFIIAPGPRGSGDYKDVEYLSVLGRMFEGNITYDYARQCIETLQNQFGNRTKAIAITKSKSDWKALSHAYLITDQAKEFLETKFLEFPVRKAEYIKSIKRGEVPADDIVLQVEDAINEIDQIVQQSDLPETSNKEFIDSVLLDLYNEL